MSESLQVVWIADYYLKVAREHGANTQNAQKETKAKKVQITRVRIGKTSMVLCLMHVSLVPYISKRGTSGRSCLGPNLR